MRERPEPIDARLRPATLSNEVFSSAGNPLLRRCDPQGLACDFDSAWLRFTGRPLETSLRNGWLQDVHPEDRDRCLSIHSEMMPPRAPYTLDYRLRHAVRGYRWMMEQAAPAFTPDGRFDGYTHWCMDIQDRTELGESLAERLGRMRCAARRHTAFAAALATELDRLPPEVVKLALQTFAALCGKPVVTHPAPRRLADWLESVLDEADALLPAEATRFKLAHPPEPLDIAFESAVLNAAFANALACTELLNGDACGADAHCLRVDRIDRALVVDLPALPGASAFALLDLALMTHGLPTGQVMCQGASPRWRVALPLSESTP